jgi:hypothetical protein
VPPGEKLALLDPEHPIERIPKEELPQCPQCKNGLQRPGVVWFGEALDDVMLHDIDKWMFEGKVVSIWNNFWLKTINAFARLTVETSFRTSFLLLAHLRKSIPPPGI